MYLSVPEGPFLGPFFRLYGTPFALIVPPLLDEFRTERNGSECLSHHSEGQSGFQNATPG
jgi:hypothetical protein